jgi:kexin
MIFWGSAVDPDKTRLFEVEDAEDVLPPTTTPMSPILPSASITTQHPKPTVKPPPDDHDEEGEKSGSNSDTEIPPALGWFDEMSRLVSNGRWVFGAISLVILFGIGVGVFFCLRRRKTAQSNYGPLANDDMSMAGLGNRGGGGRTRELYDAFGEVSDDEEDADETTKLRGAYPPGQSTEGLGFHSGFLDDEDPGTAGGVTPRREHYRDDDFEDDNDASDSGNEKSKGEARLVNTATAHSSSARTSGEGSWEHASTTTP